MKLGVVQTRAVTGDIGSNIGQHEAWIGLAASYGADVLIFSELSLTGYEPGLAKTLAIDPDDSRLGSFQALSDRHRMIIGVGAPTWQKMDVCISMILFQPQKTRQVYSKKYLHADEEPFFISGENITNRIGEIALAICYEISIPEHAEDAYAGGARFYIASVVKSKKGIGKALARLSGIAGSYSMTVLMSNAVGVADGDECAGKSSVWNDKGILLGQLDDSREGLILLDTDTQKITLQQLT